MKYLKIAAEKKLWPLLPSEWEKVTLESQPAAAELAAIVAAAGDLQQLQQIERFKRQAQLPLPIIKINRDQSPEQARSLIRQQADQYVKQMVPAFLSDLVDFADQRPISFTTPGHHNGKFYAKHPAGVVFDRFFGKNLLFADTSDTVAQLGDTMTHDGAPLTAEQQAARAYHADKVYFCTNGTTSANSICVSALLNPGDVVLFDRNNHKSLYNSALLMNGAVPVYLPADRNALGLIGETDPAAFSEKNLRQEVAKKSPLKAKAKRPFRVAILQLETYDGVFYQADWILKKIGHLCDYILFDCAWGGYEQFSSLLADLSPLNRDYRPQDPGILVTQSIHKQQAGMGQVSQILKKDSHLRGQKRYVDHKHFNHAYLKYVTSSYSYPLYASLTVNAAMAASSANRQWWQQLLVRGIKWRKELLKRSRLFHPWVPAQVDGRPWEEIPTSELASQISYWKLDPVDRWHGFQSVTAGQVRLDPFKLTITTPGIDYQHAVYQKQGIPGAVVAEFLMENGIIRGKDDLNSLLFLLTPGDDEPQFQQLLEKLLVFEQLYFKNADVTKALPQLYQANQARYRGYGLQQLCQEMHEYYRAHQTFKLQQQLFQAAAFEPNYVMSPQAAEQQFKRNHGRLCLLSQAAGKIALEGALPYPPGVFVVAPGERWQPTAQQYFEVLLGAAARFPGFEPEIQGVYYQLDDPAAAKVYVLDESESRN
ncbi:MAG: putative ornithine decarboxylase [Liquorilactobacillus nagelii]|uniref:putative ornithine decarboxylase n=1 Tax=Liquorilactobacillus nagelii TaxID=82688 RepID=UPI0039EBE87F